MNVAERYGYDKKEAWRPAFIKRFPPWPAITGQFWRHAEDQYEFELGGLTFKVRGFGRVVWVCGIGHEFSSELLAARFCYDMAAQFTGGPPSVVLSHDRERGQTLVGEKPH